MSRKTLTDRAKKFAFAAVLAAAKAYMGLRDEEELRWRRKTLKRALLVKGGRGTKGIGGFRVDGAVISLGESIEVKADVFQIDIAKKGEGESVCDMLITACGSSKKRRAFVIACDSSGECYSKGGSGVDDDSLEDDDDDDDEDDLDQPGPRTGTKPGTGGGEGQPRDRFVLDDPILDDMLWDSDD